MVTTEVTTDFAPTFYPPYFVKLIVYSGYSGEDSFLRVSQQAHSVLECAELLQKVCNKKIKMLLPIVYITRLTESKSELNVDDLAFRLQGVAHVIYEPDGCDKKLSININDGNVYENNAIIFYPSTQKQADIIDCTKKKRLYRKMYNTCYL